MSAPGNHQRVGISILELARMFPDETAAERWFEETRWPNDRHCAKCGSLDTYETKNRRPLPYRCRDCRQYFSVRTGTVLAKTNLPLRKWAFAIFLYVTTHKSVSSMRLHRDLDVTQKTAWFMLHRLRATWDGSTDELFAGPVEVDETFGGGARYKKSNAKRREARRERLGPYDDKVAVAGIRDRATNKVHAEPIPDIGTTTLRSFVHRHTAPGATVYTDGASSYEGMEFDHHSVAHSQREYVRGDVRTNGIESFRATFKRAYMGTFHHLSPKHLHRYVTEFAGRHNTRDLDTIDRMRGLVTRSLGKRLTYRELTAE